MRGKVVIVTGASSGIGRATAVSLAQQGANVVVTARRQERLNQLVTGLAAHPGERLALPGNIADPAFSTALVDQTIAHFGHIDILINNAGMGHRGPLADLPLADVRRIFDVNVFGLLALTQAAIPHMKQQGRGHIINVSSIVSTRPLPDAATYTASKTAVNFFSRSLRMELAPHNIRVTIVYPGLTATEFGQVRLGDNGGNRWGLRGTPPERVATAIANAIASGRQEVYISPLDWLFTHANRLFPRLLDSVIGCFQHHLG